MAPKHNRKAAPWRSKAPMSAQERERVAKRCGAGVCFLKPKELKYPVCIKENSSRQQRRSSSSVSRRSSCRPTQEGLMAARRRAILLHDTKVASKALRELQKLQRRRVGSSSSSRRGGGVGDKGRCHRRRSRRPKKIMRERGKF